MKFMVDLSRNLVVAASRVIFPPKRLICNRIRKEEKYETGLGAGESEQKEKKKFLRSIYGNSKMTLVERPQKTTLHFDPAQRAMK